MTERQKFDVIGMIGDVEIRRYHPCVMADVTVDAPYEKAGNLGFRPLASYITQNKIAMTAPVVQEQDENKSWIVSFVMPAEIRIGNLPIPKSSQVSLRKIEEHYAAALIFRGYTSWKVIQEKEDHLRAALSRAAIEIIGPLKIARFDPPWKPGFLRHNEVLFEIKYGD